MQLTFSCYKLNPFGHFLVSSSGKMVSKIWFPIQIALVLNLVALIAAQDVDPYPPFMEDILDKIDELTPDHIEEPELSKLVNIAIAMPIDQRFPHSFSIV